MLINHCVTLLEFSRFVTLGFKRTQADLLSPQKSQQAKFAVTVPFIVLKSAVESKKKTLLLLCTLFLFLVFFFCFVFLLCFLSQYVL